MELATWRQYVSTKIEMRWQVQKLAAHSNWAFCCSWKSCVYRTSFRLSFAREGPHLGISALTCNLAHMTSVCSSTRSLNQHPGKVKRSYLHSRVRVQVSVMVIAVAWNAWNAWNSRLAANGLAFVFLHWWLCIASRPEPFPEVKETSWISRILCIVESFDFAGCFFICLSVAFKALYPQEGCLGACQL